MARKKTTKASVHTTDFRHESAKRTNIPPAKIAAEGKVPEVGKKNYAYSPHISPVLRFDPTGRADMVRELVEKACEGKSLTPEEKEILRAVGANWVNPWLEWAGKQEEHGRRWRRVDPVALHIHERISANAILQAARRKDVQRDLFADPELDYREAIQFYRHDVDWANRIILGDSLQVMSSLSTRENLAGKVQMVYIDPPYGIKFASNFQPEVGRRDVKEKDDDLTREPEMVKAYRDTWNLGVHSYLSYLRDRILVARELLADTGSLFVQISDENVHSVRATLDEVFGADNCCGEIVFVKTTGLSQTLLADRYDFLLWYARDKEQVKYRQLFREKSFEAGSAGNYGWLELADGQRRGMTKEEKNQPSRAPEASSVYKADNITSQGNPLVDFTFRQKTYQQRWKTNPEGLRRLAGAGRLHVAANSLQYVRYLDDFPVLPFTKLWEDTATGNFTDAKIYVVQTGTKTVARCVLMTTDPGDLVLDPTCGSGTTAYVAEQWGRRWITIDTSRVAVSLARQRLLAAKFDRYRLATETNDRAALRNGRGVDPSENFAYKTVPHVKLGSIAQNENLDPIFDKHELILDQKLATLNQTLRDIDDALREALVGKLALKMQEEGLRAATDADRRRWLLPGVTKRMVESAFAEKPKLKAKHVREHIDLVPPNGRFEHWHVPFDVDPDWPESTAIAVTDYRKVWRAKLDDVNATISANAEQEELVDQPEVVKDIVRVTGPFTVEGVLPEELNVGEEGLFDGTPNEELEHSESQNLRAAEAQNLRSYLSSMVRHLKSDGVTFPDNKNPKFARLETLFDAGSASALHAEGVWRGEDKDGPATIGVGFGLQYGPVTARQVEDLIREANRRGYDELVVAGFSFDAEAHATIQEASHPKLQIHMAQIRPDLNAGMEGLLKDTPNSQLFSVFGKPAIEIRKEGDEFAVTLEGVDIYDPVRNTVQSTGAAKVAAWFLDSDFDGRCFCITQAFFPDQDVWDKLAKALKDVVKPEAFAAFKGTTSLPFAVGEHRQVAVKVIDPRGNEVMTIHKLGD